MQVRSPFYEYSGISPSVDKEAFVAENSCLIGNVTIKKDANIWFLAVLRGDVGKITVGAGTNIQDHTVIHTDSTFGNTEIGNLVTVGHGCVLHACTILDEAFVGMGSVVMDRAVIEQNGMLAAGSLLTRGKIVKSGELWVGRPAAYCRKLSEEEIASIRKSALDYVELSRKYRS